MGGVHDGEGALAADLHDDIVGECGQEGTQMSFEIGGPSPGHHARQVRDGGRANFGFGVGEHGDKAGHDEGLLRLVLPVALDAENVGGFGKVFGEVVADAPVWFL